jgi:hypothetical protein
MEVFLQLRLQVPFDHGLGDAVRDSGDLKRSDFPIVFRYFHPTVWLGLISACYEIVPDRFQNIGHTCGFDILKTLAIDARCTPISLGYTVRFLKGLPLRHMHEESPEAMRLIRLRLSINASSQLLQIIECLYHFTPASP